MRQLHLVEVSPDTVERAIRDYFRAVKERTTWVARSELLPDQIEDYDDELVRRWEPLHEDCCDNAAGGDDAALAAHGRKHFRRVQEISYPIDPRWPYQYLTLGSYHRLANIQRVGWHPEYRQHLTSVEAAHGEPRVMAGDGVAVVAGAGPVLRGDSTDE